MIKNSNKAYWSTGYGNIPLFFNRKKHLVFTKLKERYQNELKREDNKKISSTPLTKEKKRKIKERIKADYSKQLTKRILILSISIIITILAFIAASYGLKSFYEI